MQTVIDFFKDTFMNEFQTTMRGDRIAIGLLVSFFLSLFVILVYRITFRGVVLSKSFCFALVLASMVTSVIIMTVTTNLTLSLGMVGALSIVRFRTAVKDPADTVFLFWAICIGIMAGAGLVYISLITNLCLGILYLILYFVTKKMKAAPYLVMVRYKAAAADPVRNAIRAITKRTRVRSKTVNGEETELCVEIRLTAKTMHLIDDLGAIEGVLSASAISYNGDTTL